MLKKSAIFVIALTVAILIGYFITYRQVEAPVSGGMETVKVFFSNNILDPEISCEKVFPVERKVSGAENAKATIEALLLGPSESEKAEGFFTSINPGVIILDFDVKDGLAHVNFDQQIEKEVGGSCRVTAIRAQTEETLKQFPSIREVEISIEGRTEDVLQP